MSHFVSFMFLMCFRCEGLGFCFLLAWTSGCLLLITNTLVPNKKVRMRCANKQIYRKACSRADIVSMLKVSRLSSLQAPTALHRWPSALFPRADRNLCVFYQRWPVTVFGFCLHFRCLFMVNIGRMPLIMKTLQAMSLDKVSFDSWRRHDYVGLKSYCCFTLQQYCVETFPRNSYWSYQQLTVHYTWNYRSLEALTVPTGRILFAYSSRFPYNCA